MNHPFEWWMMYGGLMFIYFIRNALSGGDIDSGEWRAYNKLKIHGYKNLSINSKESFVNNKIGKYPICQMHIIKEWSALFKG